MGVQLTWDANNEGDLVGYKVRRASNEGGPYTLLSSPTLNLFNDTTGTADTFYYYRVSAIDLDGNEGDYAQVRARKLPADVTAPAAPTGLTVVKTGASSTFLDWDDNVESDLAGYWVTGATSAGGSFVSLSPALLSISQFSHTLATAPNTWYYQAYAIDDSGNLSGPASISLQLTSPDVTPPGTPSGLQINTSVSAIELLWIANTEPDLNHYLVEYAASGGGPWATVAEPVQSYQLDTSAASGAITFYRISAFDNTGNQSGFLSGSGFRPTSGVVLSLDGFVKAGQMVPCVVHARGVNLTRTQKATATSIMNPNLVADFQSLPDGTELQANYEWNMAAGAGQPQGLHPQLRGFNAAHAYEAPGSYTIQLIRTTPLGVAQTFQSVVTLAADSRQLVYVSATSTLNTGFGSITNPVSLARAQQLLSSTPAIKLLLKNGDVFEGTTEFFRFNQPNQMISNYDGGGPVQRPLLKMNNPTGGLRWYIRINTSATNAVIENLIFDQGTSTRNDVAIYFANTASTATDFQANTLIRNCHVRKVGEFVSPDKVNASTRYLLVMNNTVQDDVDRPGGLRSYFIWGAGRDVVVIGNTVQESQDEHPIRIDDPSDRWLITKNFLRNVAPTGTVQKQPIRIMTGSFHYVSENQLLAPPAGGDTSGFTGELDIGTLSSTDGNPYDRLQYVVFERNYVEARIRLEPGGSDIMIRNNVIKKFGGACLESNMAVGSQSVDKTIERVYIYNNTLIQNGTNGMFLKFNKAILTLDVWNNLGLSTTLTGQSFQVNMSNGFGTANSFSRNTWGKGANGALNRFGINGVVEQLSVWNTRTQVGEDQMEVVSFDSVNYRIPSSAVAATYASPSRPGVFNDYEGVIRRRSDSNWCCGAVETNS